MPSVVYYNNYVFFNHQAHFFNTTPQDLIDEGLYKTIAVALHEMPHREVSLALVAQVSSDF